MTHHEQSEINKKIATDMYIAYGIERNVEKLRKYFGDIYIQHNPNVEEGVERFYRFVEFRRTHFPAGRNNIMLTIADGNLVMFHVHSVLTPGDAGRNLVDTYRVEDGKVVEHWDVIQDVEVTKFPSIHDHGLFNIQGDAILKDPDKTAENRKLVTDFYRAFGIEKDAEKCAQYLGERYIEHNPKIQDGLDNFLRFVKFRHDHYPEGRNEIKLTVAQGNLVGFHVHSVLTPEDPGRNVVDIFRVENGKIVEHWDTAQKIEAPIYPPLTDNGLY